MTFDLAFELLKINLIGTTSKGQETFLCHESFFFFAKNENYDFPFTISLLPLPLSQNAISMHRMWQCVLPNCICNTEIENSQAQTILEAILYNKFCLKKKNKIILKSYINSDRLQQQQFNPRRSKAPSTNLDFFKTKVCLQD